MVSEDLSRLVEGFRCVRSVMRDGHRRSRSKPRHREVLRAIASDSMTSAKLAEVVVASPFERVSLEERDDRRPRRSRTETSTAEDLRDAVVRRLR